MMEVADMFKRYCGPSVRFITHDRSGSDLKITYDIPAIASEPRVISVPLRNGLAPTLYLAIRALGERASNDAYNRTGHREADMKRLLSGRTV